MSGTPHLNNGDPDPKDSIAASGVAIVSCTSDGNITGAGLSEAGLDDVCRRLISELE